MACRSSTTVPRLLGRGSSRQQPDVGAEGKDADGADGAAGLVELGSRLGVRAGREERLAEVEARVVAGRLFTKRLCSLSVNIRKQ